MQVVARLQCRSFGLISGKRPAPVCLPRTSSAQVSDGGRRLRGLVGDGGMMASVLMRLAHLAVTNAFAALRLPTTSGRDKVVEILVLRHQLAVLQRQLGPPRPGFTSADRAFLSALLVPLSREVLRRLQLLVRPETVLRHQPYGRSSRPKAPIPLPNGLQPHGLHFYAPGPRRSWRTTLSRLSR
jgi:hypothetical protein